MENTAIPTENPGFQWSNMFPDILWILFWLIIFFSLRNFILTALTTIMYRLKHGAGMKIGSFEIESLKVAPNGHLQNHHFNIEKDKNDVREGERNKVYENHRGAMLVHKIFKSQKDGQLYDILIYIIPKKDCNLIQLTSVDYYFGKFWNQNVYTSCDRSNGFAIATSAYGPFLCTAKLNFNDGKSETVYRFIDFEMGDVAAIANEPKS